MRMNQTTKLYDPRATHNQHTWRVCMSHSRPQATKSFVGLMESQQLKLFERTWVHWRSWAAKCCVPDPVAWNGWTHVSVLATNSLAYFPRFADAPLRALVE